MPEADNGMKYLQDNKKRRMEVSLSEIGGIEKYESNRNCQKDR